MNSTTKHASAAFLKQPGIDWQQILEQILSSHNCTTGTIHVYDSVSNLLKLRAHQGIPDFLLSKTREIPLGKGMAGIAAERLEPVEMCNLQTDSSGVARPAAKDTKVVGSIAIPMLLDRVLYGTLGIAKSISYDFTQEEKNCLLDIGRELSFLIQKSSSQRNKF